jgi:signal transduction histidine kinase
LRAYEKGQRPGEHDEWQRFLPAWHAAFAGLSLLTGGLVATDDGLDAGARYTALALIVALGGWYTIVGTRGARHRPGWPGLVYLAVAGPANIALLAIAPVGALMLCALYPHFWVMLRPRHAIAATVAAVAAVGAVTVARNPLDRSASAAVVLFSVVSLALALLLGLWIARIITQSRQRAELIAELAATRAELAVVSRQAGALAERERLAHEIHDTLAQGYTSVLLLLDAARLALSSEPAAAIGHLDRAEETARENLFEARALVAALIPPELSGTSLPEALRRLVERAEVQSLPRAELTVTGTPRGLPPEHEVALLRMVQESLTNVRRHAGATEVDVRLAYQTDRVTLQVRDDGRGFDPDLPPDGHGLAGIRARAQRIGAVARIDAALGSGVTVWVDVPAECG